MTEHPAMRILALVSIALTACSLAGNGADNRSSAKAAIPPSARGTARQAPAGAATSANVIPAKYLKAFMCEFDENPDVAARRFHETPGGRAERRADLTVLRSLGFTREASNFGLDSVGGKAAAPAGTMLFGLPVQSFEINGMIGDYNALYVTRFADQVSVSQVVTAARLALDRASFAKYGSRYYARSIATNPYTALKLYDSGHGPAQLTCEIRSTPD